MDPPPPPPVPCSPAMELFLQSLRREHGWLMLECLRAWNEDDSKTVDENLKQQPTVSSAARRESKQGKASPISIFLLPTRSL